MSILQKIKVFMLSHFFSGTYNHYCSLQLDCNNLIERLQNKDAEIAELKESGNYQELEIQKLREINFRLENEIVGLRNIIENHQEKIVQYNNMHLEDVNQIEKYEKSIEDNKITTQLLNEYIVGYHDHDLSNMSRFQYENLHRVLESNEVLGVEAFKIISTNIYNNNIDVIKSKSKIKVAFLAPQASLWSCDSIYNRLTADSRFDVFIIIVPFEYGSDKNIICEMYEASCNFFEEKKYNCCKAYNSITDSYLTFEEAGAPDIVFHLTPHTSHIHKNFQIESFHLNVLNIYIPYGIMIVDGYQIQFNQKSHHMCWKIFCETPIHKNMTYDHSTIKDINVECSGYVKMDPFLDGTLAGNANTIWKLSDRNKSVEETIKIIWAPHHALVEHPYAFGTFHKNYQFFYEIAKSMPEISWIVKPHPLLKNDSIYFGVFNNPEEYDEYMRKWDELPNARTVHEGSYIDIFKTSDAMILDSVSFLAEYLFVQKPCLFLTKACDTFNQFGDIVKESHYQVDGEDLNGIKEFIDEVLIRKNDSMKEIRAEIFDKYLNYFKFNNGQLASNYIYNYLCDNFFD